MADKVLGLASDRDANLKYGAIQAFVYAFTFIGGIFADKVLGFKITPFGASVMILGNLIIAFSLHFSIWELHSIIGTGFFKPNISSMVGSFIKWGQS
jgi:POT family proton-dependent oligopeptide transporter